MGTCKAISKAEISRNESGKDVKMCFGAFAGMCNIIVYLYNVYGGMFIWVSMILSLFVLAMSRRIKGKTYENK